MLDVSLSQYARKFDESCYGWTDDKEYLFMYLKHLEKNFNELLVKRGYVFLRDIYEMLGIPITKTSCIVGWKVDREHLMGDNFIEISIQEDENSKLWLDFNVDGNIIDRL